jgi:hypothetical protein
VAVLWAAVSGHSFGQDLRVTTLSVGIVLLLMAAIGRGSNFDRAMDFGAAHQYWGHVPGMSSIHRTGEDSDADAGRCLRLDGRGAARARALRPLVAPNLRAEERVLAQRLSAGLDIPP